MKKGTTELSLEKLIMILLAIAIAALVLFVMIWVIVLLRSSNTCDFVCSLKESLLIFKYVLPKISSCRC